jgi:DtxR family Mn-dependent transcriptional regulator
MTNKVQSGVLTVGSDRSASRAREDYVKAIHQLGDAGPVKAAGLARYLGVSRVSVSKAKRSLERDGFLEPSAERSDPLQLTWRGQKLAIAMVRRHRLLETFLHRLLDVPLERVHSEAERIEHAISDDIARRIANLLGRPARDPHGHRIPYGDRDGRSEPTSSLASVPVGARARVISLDDRDDEGVASLAAARVLPGSAVTIERKDARTVRVRCGNRKVTLLVRHAAMVRIATI